MEGLFVAGDVRAGSTEQVGSAAGEGIAALLSATTRGRQVEQWPPSRARHQGT